MVNDKKDMRCSFCGKNPNEVFKLIAGNDVFICDECVEPVSYTHLIFKNTFNKVAESYGKCFKNF